MLCHCCLGTLLKRKYFNFKNTNYQANIVIKYKKTHIDVHNIERKKLYQVSTHIYLWTSKTVRTPDTQHINNKLSKNIGLIKQLATTIP